MEQDSPIWDCVDCHCLAARRTARAITHLYEERLRPHGLRATQFSILAALALKGPTVSGELAELLGLEHTSLTRGASVMKRNGWLAVERTSDARQRRLRLTPSGERKLEAAYPDWKVVQDALDSGDVEIPGRLRRT